MIGMGIGGYWSVLGVLGASLKSKHADEEFPKRGIEAGGVNAI